MRPSEQQRQEMMEDDDPDLEKKDHFALWVSGMITVALPCLLHSRLQCSHCSLFSCLFPYHTRKLTQAEKRLQSCPAKAFHF